MKIQSGRSSTPYKAPGARGRRNMAEGGSAKPKREVKLRKDGEMSNLTGRKADKIRAAAKAGEKGEIKTGFLGLGKRYKIVDDGKAKAKAGGGGSKPKAKAKPKPSTQLDTKGATPRKNPHAWADEKKKKKTDPRSDVTVTKRDLGRDKNKDKDRASQSDRGEYRRADEMKESTRARGARGSNLAARVRKINSEHKSDRATALYSKAEQARRKEGAKRKKTRAGTSEVKDIDIKSSTGSKSRKDNR